MADDMRYLSARKDMVDRVELGGSYPDQSSQLAATTLQSPDLFRSRPLRLSNLEKSQFEGSS
jgi:hypothetical protein